MAQNVEMNADPAAENNTPNEPAPTRPCELCEAAQFTHWYADDDVCWAADCEACLVPMVVWKSHGTEPSEAELNHMRTVLTAAADVRFGPGEFVLDEVMRTIPEHWHAHARDTDWFHLRGQRPLSRFTGIGTPRQERG